MDNKYKRLIFLAEETDVPSTDGKIKEINILLGEIDKKIIDKKHYRILDELISILYTTGNVSSKYDSNVNGLQSFLRCEI